MGLVSWISTIIFGESRLNEFDNSSPTMSEQKEIKKRGKYRTKWMIEMEDKDGVYYSKIAGIAYKNDDGSSRQDILKKCCKAQDNLKLIRDPNNKYDPNAIGIFTEHGQQLGFTSSNISKWLAPLMEDGKTPKCYIKELKTDHEPWGCNIYIDLYWERE